MSEDILQLDDYVSLHNREIHFLNLDRCLQQPSHVKSQFDNEMIGGISLARNYLLQMPTFVSDYPNLSILNVSHNGLNTADFILYKARNPEELTESYWHEKFQRYATRNPPPERTSQTRCRTNPNEDRVANVDSRPLVHPLLKSIDCSHNHIKFLPNNIHHLRFLHTLDLSHNYLEELPANFGHLAQLSSLLLNNNSLRDLPATFTRLTQLRTLNFSFNQFRSIATLKNLPNLKSFALDSNPLQTFPTLLNTCSNLEDLSLSNIRLDQMPDISLDYFQTFVKLKKLSLANNNLSDAFLSSSNASFDCLEELNLDGNQLTSIFSLLTNSKCLHVLNLNSNAFTRIPPCSNPSLEILYLSHNNIELHAEDCEHLKDLLELELDHNQISRIPNEFLQCQVLQSFNIAFNPIKQFPQIVSQLLALNKLVIKSSQLQFLPSTDLFKRYFFRTMNILDLSSNSLFTNCKELTVLRALTYLDLSDNRLSELHQDFRFLTCLRVLKLTKNKFTQVPSCLYQIATERHQTYIAATLMELHIGDNQIKAIPEEIIHMVNVQTLDLSNNPFSTFPEPLVYLEQLTCLIYTQEHGIHINQLPEDFIHLNNLRRLDLSHNTFDEIPPMIYHLSKLEYLNLNFNLLTALDNQRLRQLQNLKVILLDGNSFSSFPSALYRLEKFSVNDSSKCFAPPTDFLKERSMSAASNLFVHIHDQHEQTLFQLYQEIFLENLSSYDIESLLIRLKLSKEDIDHFRKTNSYPMKREEKIQSLLLFWKEKRGSLANAESLWKLSQIIGDKKLVQQIKRTSVLARKIRI